MIMKSFIDEQIPSRIVDYTLHWAKFLFLKCDGIVKRISYERRVYESVDDKSLS